MSRDKPDLRRAAHQRRSVWQGCLTLWQTWQHSCCLASKSAMQNAQVYCAMMMRHCGLGWWRAGMGRC